MNTKAYLNQIKRLDMMINNKLAEIYRLKNMASGIFISTDSERVQASGNKDRLGNTVAKIIDLERETDKLIDILFDKRNNIIKQIDSLSNSDYYQILALRYVNYDTFNDISGKTGWSIRQVFRLHGEALQEFEKAFGQSYL